MINWHQFFVKAGSVVSLPFLLFAIVLLPLNAYSAVEEKEVVTFHEFKSSCIDLGNYDSNRLQLTVRFANRKPDHFYRYQNVPPEIWNRLESLNDKGGVGNYLNEAVVQHPDKYPFREIKLKNFKTSAKQKKPKIRNESPAF